MTSSAYEAVTGGGLATSKHASTLVPAFPSRGIVSVEPGVHLGVVIPVTVLVALLFLWVITQLLLVLYQGHKLLTYQTVFLFSVLLWAGLRLTLYSFYYEHCCIAVNNLPPGWKWFLLAFPQNIQFFTLALLVHYFGQVFFKALRKRQERIVIAAPRSLKLTIGKYVSAALWLVLVLSYLATNLTFSLLISLRAKNAPDNITLSRVLVSEVLFLILALLLSILVIIVYTTSVGRQGLEAQGTPKYQAILLSFLISALYFSRCIYNIVVVQISVTAPSYGYGWTNASDLGDNEWKGNYGYISYFLVLLFWEVLPTCLIVIFFRVKLPCSCHCKRSDTSDRGRNFFTKSYFSIGTAGPVDSSSDSLIGSINRSRQVDIPGPSIQHGYGYGGTDPTSASNATGGSYFKSPAAAPPGMTSGALINPGRGGSLFSS